MSMASSSLSQESLDHDDFDLSSRRSRMRGTRSRAIPIYNKNESVETTDDKDVDDEDYSRKAGLMQPMEEQSTMLLAGSAGMEHISFSPGCMLFPSDHDSPTRAKVKDKRGWPGHLHKAKPAKDKRKLREKRRSSGLVHMQSTESTGDSLDETDKDRCTYNEVIDADNPQTPEEDRKAFAGRGARNKSPSDLDADLEDNQDYDSTVSQPDTNSSQTAAGQKKLDAQSSASSLLNAESPAAAAASDQDQLYRTLTKSDVRAQEAAMSKDGCYCSTVFTAEPDADGCSGEKGDGTSDPAKDRGTADVCVVLEQMLTKEREKNSQLQRLVEQKERIISDLERRLADLTKHAV